MIRDIVILALFRDAPRHGYEIKKHLGTIFGNKEFLNNNQLYPALHRMVEEGFLERTGGAATKSNRILYSITDAGARHLFEMLKSYGDAEAGSEEEFLTRVSMFEHLPAEDREWILKLRRSKLEERIRHDEGILARYANEPNLVWPWGMEVLRFRNIRFRAELAWIEELLGKVADGPIGGSR